MKPLTYTVPNEVAGRPDADKDALSSPGAGHKGAFYIPTQPKVVEQIFVFFVPTTRDSHRPRGSELGVPTLTFAHFVWVRAKVPDAGKVEHITDVVLNGVKHGAAIENVRKV